MNLPDDSQKVCIIGRTGSGKTQAGLWHLSLREFDVRPWLIVDYKRAGLLREVGAQEITLDETPEEPELYIVHPLPSDTEAMEQLLWRIWQRGDCGLFIDEAFMVGANNEAFNALLTQGREKRVPMIICTQRPVWLSRFVFSESDFFQVFHLNDRKDRQTIQGFVPVDLDVRLLEHWSYYYDVGDDAVTRLKPVPPAQAIFQSIHSRLSEMRPHAAPLPEAQQKPRLIVL